MKTLTLHQPWASLISLGVKTIETRSWSTKYRGPLLIHAAKRNPRREQVGDWHVFPAAAEWIEGGEARMSDRPHTVGAATTPVPLGAIVASCRLVDVVPIKSRWANGNSHHERVVYVDRDHLILCTPGETPVWREVSDQRPYGDFAPGRYAWILEDVKPTTERCPVCWGTGERYEERPEDGSRVLSSTRIVCVCGDAGICPPIPAKGKQGLWEFAA